MTEALVYLNGRMVPASEANLAIYDAGVVQGATVTEMTRTFRRQLFRLDDHLDRLWRALRFTRLDIGIEREEMARISQELVDHNGRLLEGDTDLGLVQFVTAGEHSTYAGRPVRRTPTVCVHTFPLPFESWANKMVHGAHVVTPSIRQVPPQCWPPGMKCRSRMHYYLAEQEVRLVDPEAYALLLDLEGNITETNAANILLVERGTLISPPLANLLPGISRATVLDLAARMDISCVERDLSVFSVMNADEAFLTSTSFCMMPVTKINGVAVGDGRPGPLYRRLLDAWSRTVGVDIEQQIMNGARRE
jgi:branched-subunit amino acid aminotransferase/4-amino-4-deoxychorismate lyase